MPVFGKQKEQLKGDTLQPDEMALVAKLERARVKLEALEVDDSLKHDAAS
jgi:hypothetical protein